MRNEILHLQYLILSEEEKDKKYHLEELINNIEYRLKKERMELRRQIDELTKDLELLESVKGEITNG